MRKLIPRYKFLTHIVHWTIHGNLSSAQLLKKFHCIRGTQRYFILYAGAHIFVFLIQNVNLWQAKCFLAFRVIILTSFRNSNIWNVSFSISNFEHTAIKYITEEGQIWMFIIPVRCSKYNTQRALPEKYYLTHKCIYSLKFESLLSSFNN